MFQDQSGLGQGLQQLLQGIGQGLEKRAERQSLQDILSGGQPVQDVTQTPEFQDQFMSMVNQHEEATGEKLPPEAVNMLWNTQKAQAQKAGPREYTTEQLAAISQRNPQLANMLQQGQIARRKEDLAERKISSQKETSLMKMNEPKLLDVGESLEALKQAESDYDTLEELSKDSGKFPSAVTAALIDIDSENGLSRIGRSLLTPEAQQYIKIIVNQLKNARDTFGARVTNFEAAKFLQGLPTLMNTAKGRERIIRDLKIVNKINQLHKQGILDAFNELGGSSKVSFSQARELAEKRISKQVEDLKKQRLNPNKKTFSSMPDPSLYNGKDLIDDTTNQRFTSDGKKWIPIG